MAEFVNITDGWAESIDTLSPATIEKMELSQACYEYRDEGVWPEDIVGIIHHATAGCGGLVELRSSLERQETSVHFGIDRLGNIAQYLPLTQRARHAQAADNSWFAIEHIASTKCNHTTAQLNASVQLAAAIINWVSDEGVGNIPVSRGSGRPPYNGLADHVQGGEYWGNHVDGLMYAPAPNWNWSKYIVQVQNAL